MSTHDPRPVIGVTGQHKDIQTVPGTDRAVAVAVTYTEMVWEAGGLPVVLVPGDPTTIPVLADRLDGLVLSGGPDVDPRLYGGDPDHPSIEGADPYRDEYEIALILEARRRRMPVLAICRGAQVLNVALGGTLIEDVPTMVSDELGHDRGGPESRLAVHRLQVDPESATARALGCSSLFVNSIHHQSVRDLAAGLRAVGRTDDGVIEAYEPEHGDDWPMIAVQWHPEYLGPADPPSLALFADLVASASR
ncbi:MAG TPA: gamma-glutamyl-gamma-aminobutyrate hydrolase family protein [Acidimicrobiia bacterium]|nr:gamma-glutamyl-gamma-aminobutyrate hydrolase family protein [Acidimicrobiia bacterium]